MLSTTVPCSLKWESVILHFNYSKMFRDGWFVIPSTTCLHNRYNSYWKVVGGRVGGRQMCSLKWESVTLHFDYSKIFINGWFVISLIDVPTKNANR